MKNYVLCALTFIAPIFLFGQNQALTKEETLEVVKQALEEQSTIELGTFRLKTTKIDKSDSKDVKFYTDTKIYTDSGDIDSENGKTSLKITSVEIDIRDGNIYDVRVKADNNGTNLLFTNERPLALSHFNRPGKWRLYNVDRANKEKNIDLKSILEYDYKTGENYVIEEEIVTLDMDNEFQHKVTVSSNLKDLIDFRIYSDFLGLINEQANGIISFEASSTFFLFPKPFDYGKRDRGFVYLFKKVVPHVNYSRFDNDDRALNLTELNLETPDFSDNTLTLVQRSFLNVGGTLDLFEYEPFKFSSVKFFGKLRANLFVTETETAEDAPTDPDMGMNMDEDMTVAEDESNQENTTTLSWGVGLEVQSKRYSNFGVSASVYWDRYQNNNLLEDSVLNFNTLSFGSEAFFYTGNNTDNAIFLRLNYTQGQRNINTSANFFTIQFGYRAELKINRNTN